MTDYDILGFPMSESSQFKGSDDEIDKEYQRLFIRCQERYFNDLVKLYGFVTLNQVLSGLGFAPDIIFHKYVFTRPFEIQTDRQNKIIKLVPEIYHFEEEK